MFLTHKLLFIYTETPLHAGSGAGLGAVDLPIQRERTTGYPLVQASGIKGALRSEAEARQGKNTPEIVAIFGPETNNAHEHAGAVAPGDARLLLFPVRSLIGVFAWTISVDTWARFCRDAAAAGITGVPQPPAAPGERSVYVSGNGVTPDNTVVLEEFAFEVIPSDNQPVRNLATWLAEHALPGGNEYRYWREKLKTSLVVLPEDAFRDFTLHSTEIITRTRLTEQKTVAQGALWTEEHLPTDTLLYAPVHASRLRSDNKPTTLAKDTPSVEAQAVLNWLTDASHIPHRLQLGGDETVGRGLVALRWHPESSPELLKEG